MPRNLSSPAGKTARLGAFRSITRFAIPAAIPLGMAGTVLLLPMQPAKAVPAFAEQTGMPCQACHVGGFGPQLTPFGREFKLEGYTLRAKPSIPLSAMAVASLTHTAADQVPPPDGVHHVNDNLAFDQGSLFLAGGLGSHFGGFAQVTYDGVAKQWSWDNLDLRAVTKGRLLGQDAVFGLTLNNSPTVQDVWNTTPGWGFPYTDTAVSPTPGASPLIDGALAQNTLGLTGYAWIGQKFFLEGGAYSSPAAGTLSWLGADPANPGDIHGLAPYGRIAFQNQLGGGTFAVGAFALKAAIFPGRDRSTGFADHYSDVGIDTSWQKTIGADSTVSTQLRYLHETNDLQASCFGTSGDCAKNHLNEWRGDVSYSWHGKVGATLGGFSITGNDNYAGTAASPDSQGVIAQLDYTPWGSGNSPLGPRVNMRLGAQYTAYGKFDGTSVGASDNNALRIFTWLAF